MDPMDQKLSELLHEWQEPEPRPGFESRVWGRIRSPQPLTDWLWPQPAWTGLAAAAAGIMIGLAAGLGPLPRRADADFALLRTGTIAGNYVTMISGGK